MALHVINNMTSMVSLPFIDFSTIFDRQAGAGDASVLWQVALMATAAALMLWRARVTGVRSEAAPGAQPPPPVPVPGAPVWVDGGHQPPAGWSMTSHPAPGTPPPGAPTLPPFIPTQPARLTEPGEADHD